MRGIGRIVGIDPGYYVSAASVVSFGQTGFLPFRWGDASSFRTKITNPLESRDELRDTIQHRIIPFVEKAMPDMVAIEDPFSLGVSVAKKLCTVRVMIEEELHKRGVEWINVSPPTWRAHVRRFHGPGVSPKMMKATAARMVGMKPSTDEQDIADSIWIGATGLFILNGESWDADLDTAETAG